MAVVFVVVLCEVFLVLTCVGFGLMVTILRDVVLCFWNGFIVVLTDGNLSQCYKRLKLFLKNFNKKLCSLSINIYPNSILETYINDENTNKKIIELRQMTIVLMMKV